MASGSRGDRHIHQDYIARIRYSNALPPPPNPPKLLDIPNTGLINSQYTAPSFASRLAREQPLNIEADAEMGMHINLVGIPGVFEGEEAAIQAPAVQPTPDIRDAPLLKPLHSLGKPKTQDGGVSFLRRTEYTAATINSKRSINPFMPSAKQKPPTLSKAGAPTRKRLSPEPDRDSPASIKRKIDDSFTAAKRLRTGNLKHPSRKQARLVASMPILPDLECFPDSGAYVTVKFATNPMTKSTVYDSRVTAGLLRPHERTETEEAIYAAQVEAWETGGRVGAAPTISTNYEFYLCDGKGSADSFRKKLDYANPDRFDEKLYPDKNTTSSGVFSYKRVRSYETAKEVEFNHMSKYMEELLLVTSQARDGHGAGDGGDVAYLLPVMQRTTLQPQRAKNIARNAGAKMGMMSLQDEDEPEIVDQLDITVEEPTGEILDAIQQFKERPQFVEAEEPVQEVPSSAGANAARKSVEGLGSDDGADGDVYEMGNATQVAPGGFGDDDAEGEEDD